MAWDDMDGVRDYSNGVTAAKMTINAVLLEDFVARN